MDKNISGTWTGEISGTNTGGMLLHLVQELDRVYGTGRFHEAALGVYEYDIQGVGKGNDFSFFLTPKPNDVLQLGTIQASCRLTETGELVGQWTSSLDTAGVFTACRPDSVIPTNKLTATTLFLVHGQDEATKEKVARFLERLGVEVIVLQEKVNQGMTIVEKFEEYAGQAGFAVVLFTPDDVGYPLGSENRKRPRARQNVVLEMGYFMGRLSRERVCVLYKGGVELPSDILGVVYHPFDDAGGWRLTLAAELKRAGYPVDLNKIIT